MRFARVVAFALLVLLVMLGTARAAAAQGPCGPTYTVRPGDTLFGIARRCQTTVPAILQVNPQIVNPNRIFVGQRITIPVVEPDEREVLISPTSGPPGTVVNVEGRVWPFDTPIVVRLGRVGTELTPVLQLRTSLIGTFTAQVTIPDTAQAGEQWVVQAATIEGPLIQGTSQPFTVAAPDPPPTTYVVQPGDTLFSIARRFGTTVQAILQANPQIVNPNRIFIGQRIAIPVTEPDEREVLISPTSGPPGTVVNVEGRVWPFDTPIVVQVGRVGTELTPVLRLRTSLIGTFTTQVTIPATAQAGEQWLVRAETIEGPLIRGTSPPFTVTAPTPITYVVQPGDTLFSIARRFGTTVQAILQANPQIVNPNRIFVGQRIVIPQ
jgi:LysM repeat protein